MKEMINTFTRVLERFKFREALPETVRKLLYAYRKDSIRNALRHFGEYTVMNRMTVNTFYAARAVKLRPSMAQSRAAIWISSALAVVLLLIGYMLFAGVNEPVEVPAVVHVPETEVIQEVEKEKPVLPEEKIEIVNVKRIAVKPLTSSFMNKRALNSATDAIYKRLSALKGRERVINLKSGKQGYSYLLSGSVEKLGKTLIISADLVDAESGKVIYNKLERTNDAESINKIFRQIAEEAGGMVKF